MQGKYGATLAKSQARFIKCTLIAGDCLRFGFFWKSRIGDPRCRRCSCFSAVGQYARHYLYDRAVGGTWGRSCDPPLPSDAAVIHLPPGMEMSAPTEFVGWRDRAALSCVLLRSCSCFCFCCCCRYCCRRRWCSFVEAWEVVSPVLDAGVRVRERWL